MPFRLVRIVGDSMAPDLPNGAYALFRKTRDLREGHTVLVDHPDFGRIVKRIGKIDPAGVTLQGTDPRSTSSERLGCVPLSAIRGRYWLRLAGPR